MPHYIVLQDDNEFTMEDIINLSFDMCHMYSCSDKIISLPAPLYNAHLAAARGEVLEHSGDNSQDSGDDDDDDERETKIKTKFGKCDMKNNKVKYPIFLKDWFIFWLDYDHDEEKYNHVKNAFQRNMQKCFKAKGIEYDRPITHKVTRTEEVEDLFEEAIKKKPDARFALFFIGDRFDSIKSCEKKYGIMTQCINYEKFKFASQSKDETKLETYINNVALKINVKMGGTNNLVNIDSHLKR